MEAAAAVGGITDSRQSGGNQSDKEALTSSDLISSPESAATAAATVAEDTTGCRRHTSATSCDSDVTAKTPPRHNQCRRRARRRCNESAVGQDNKSTTVAASFASVNDLWIENNGGDACAAVGVPGLAQEQEASADNDCLTQHLSMIRGLPVAAASANIMDADATANISSTERVNGCPRDMSTYRNSFNTRHVLTDFGSSSNITLDKSYCDVLNFYSLGAESDSANDVTDGVGNGSLCDAMKDSQRPPLNSTVISGVCDSVTDQAVPLEPAVKHHCKRHISSESDRDKCLAESIANSGNLRTNCESFEPRNAHRDVAHVNHNRKDKSSDALNSNKVPNESSCNQRDMIDSVSIPALSSTELAAVSAVVNDSAACVSASSLQCADNHLTSLTSLAAGERHNAPPSAHALNEAFNKCMLPALSSANSDTASRDIQWSMNEARMSHAYVVAACTKQQRCSTCNTVKMQLLSSNSDETAQNNGNVNKSRRTRDDDACRVFCPENVKQEKLQQQQQQQSSLLMCTQCNTNSDHAQATLESCCCQVSTVPKSNTSDSRPRAAAVAAAASDATGAITSLVCKCQSATADAFSPETNDAHVADESSVQSHSVPTSDACSVDDTTSSCQAGNCGSIERTCSDNVPFRCASSRTCSPLSTVATAHRNHEHVQQEQPVDSHIPVDGMPSVQLRHSVQQQSAAAAGASQRALQTSSQAAQKSCADLTKEKCRPAFVLSKVLRINVTLNYMYANSQMYKKWCYFNVQ